MKFRLFMCGLFAAIILITASAVAAAHAVFADSVPMKVTIENTEIPEVYRDLLDGYTALILKGSDDFESEDGELGVLEAMIGLDRDEALRSVGYAFTDFSGDGQPELIIGEVLKDQDEPPYGNMIYAVFSSADGEPRLIVDGWQRNSYRWLGGGDFYYSGSNGAAQSAFGTFTLSPDGLSTIWKDFYFSSEKSGTSQEIGFYRNTTGNWDPSASEELNVTEAEFWENARPLLALLEETRKMELIPFAGYAPEAKADAAPPVRALWAEDVLSEYSAYDEFAASDHELRVRVLYETNRTVRDFRVLGLTFEDFSADGKPVFTEEELYRQDRLTSDRPLVVELVFYGDLPNNGISYTDASGTVRKFALQLSGLDGSLLLVEF